MVSMLIKFYMAVEDVDKVSRANYKEPLTVWKKPNGHADLEVWVNTEESLIRPSLNDPRDMFNVWKKS